MRPAFAAAPTSSYSTTNTISLVLSSSLEVRSTGVPISNRYLDFGDGRGYLVATPDQPLTASYSTTGPKRIKVRYTYSDTSSLESWFDITVLNIAASSAVTYVGGGGKGNSTLGTFDGRVNPISGVRAGGTAYVILGANHTEITKPFIIAEGFDPSDVAPLIQRNLSIKDFRDATTTPNGFNFYSSYINAGYDLIYIDYDRGTGDILLNAALFEEVLNRVNAAKVGSEQNVVMGISMGGVIARYQLADMVKNNRPTQTRLLILQDSPQRGANVPLGIQALLRQANISFGSFTIFDINKYLQQATALLDSPASQQLLLYRATDATSGFAANTFIEGAYRQKITFPTGQAPPYQIIAASQGSQCGTPLFAPYTELLRLDGKIFISPLPWIRRTTYYAQTIANALPAGGQSNRVATLQLYTIVRLFGFINIRINFIRQDYSCPSGLLAVDGVAGGTNYIGGYIPAGVLPQPASYGFGPFFQLAYSYTFAQNFCFVPTASALDLNDFNQSTLSGQNSNGVSTTSFSRTNGFIAYSPQENPPATTSAYFNAFHTTFTARNGQWMFNQMQGVDAPSSYCTNECTPTNLAITGPGTLCGTATYTAPIINGPNQSQTYTWTATPASAFTVAAGTGPTFTTANMGSGTIGTITLVIGGACPLTLTQQIRLGAPDAAQVQLTSPFDGCANQTARGQIVNYDPATVYTLTTSGYISAGFDYAGSQTFWLSGVTIGNQGGGTIFITARNNCGTTQSQYQVVTPSCSPNGNPGNPGPYPNPAPEEFLVVAQDGTANLDSAPAMPQGGIRTVRVLDNYGTLRLEQTGRGARQVRVSVHSLPVGNYLVQIVDTQGQTVRRQLQVAR